MHLYSRTRLKCGTATFKLKCRKKTFNCTLPTFPDIFGTMIHKLVTGNSCLYQKLSSLKMSLIPIIEIQNKPGPSLNKVSDVYMKDAFGTNVNLFF